MRRPDRDLTLAARTANLEANLKYERANLTKKARAEIWVKFKQIGRVNSDKFWLNSRQNLTRSTKKSRLNLSPKRSNLASKSKPNLAGRAKK
ncbi:hypothetical protein CAMRE0001_1939 [Campylobacter rectus RM3267]|uniref:Uncharacterized protein n=2 Tax=Campylobacter rectus TaxID=203 RepID=A0A6G5QPY0_CAMRE|nr:hypothetical protein CAMRE0001_1939 [Campylobacter rectus RM3267]QCD47720.1 hypothetical protein CRECT_2117 [Campylobacter rectus]